MSQTFSVYDFNETQIKPMMSQTTQDKEILMTIFNEIKTNQISMIGKIDNLSNLCEQINIDIMEIKEKLNSDFDPILIENSDIEQIENEQNEPPPLEEVFNPFNVSADISCYPDQNEPPPLEEVFNSFEVSTDISCDPDQNEPPPLEEVVATEVHTNQTENEQSEPVKPKRIYNRRKK